jgi:hypothetical protein
VLGRIDGGGGGEYVKSLYVLATAWGRGGEQLRKVTLCTHRTQNTGTHAHEIANVPVYMTLGLTDFDGGKNITRFWAQMVLASLRFHGPKKFRFSGSTPSM